MNWKKYRWPLVRWVLSEFNAMWGSNYSIKASPITVFISLQFLVNHCFLNFNNYLRSRLLDWQRKTTGKILSILITPLCSSIDSNSHCSTQSALDKKSALEITFSFLVIGYLYFAEQSCKTTLMLLFQLNRIKKYLTAFKNHITFS